MAAFDPLYREPEVAPAQRERGFDEFTLPEQIVDLFDVGERGEQGRGWGRRKTIKWRFGSQMLNRIRYSVRTRHKINFRYANRLRNIETNEYTV